MSLCHRAIVPSCHVAEVDAQNEDKADFIKTCKKETQIRCSCKYAVLWRGMWQSCDVMSRTGGSLEAFNIINHSGELWNGLICQKTEYIGSFCKRHIIFTSNRRRENLKRRFSKQKEKFKWISSWCLAYKFCFLFWIESISPPHTPSPPINADLFKKVLLLFHTSYMCRPCSKAKQQTHWSEYCKYQIGKVQGIIAISIWYIM